MRGTVRPWREGHGSCRRADLTGANLSEAILLGANLTRVRGCGILYRVRDPGASRRASYRAALAPVKAAAPCSRSRAWWTWWAPWRVHWPPVRVRCPVAFSLPATFAPVVLGGPAKSDSAPRRTPPAPVRRPVLPPAPGPPPPITATCLREGGVG